MNMGTLSLLVIYFAIILGVLAFLAIFLVHLRPYRQFISGEKWVFRAFFTFLAIIAIFGVFKIITGSDFSFSDADFDITKYERKDF